MLILRLYAFIAGYRVRFSVYYTITISSFVCLFIKVRDNYKQISLCEIL